jgi:hypothetical protein
MTTANVAGLSAMGIGFCSLIVVLARLCERNILVSPAMEEDEASQEREEESRRKRKEYILTGLNVKEWSPDDPPVESTEEWSPDNPPVESTQGDQDTQPSGEAVVVPQPPAPPIDSSSSPAACAMGSDDCESLTGEEELAGCAICLSHFKPQQLVCESSSSSCQHVFHKECMVNWLMKLHDECPMCREIYILKAV